ncbi:outer membrane lipoprotein-sorting protein [Ghiorsea bivora]|uniref:outer membrane lipoprotein-sorting protein n=1 Tax=Ghiorsea bivora TaxID=1485545 RepID=UPI00057171F3|nr:outer membrane lipoprotein-sorting protein [Ghiorsea bivora]
MRFFWGILFALIIANTAWANNSRTSVILAEVDNLWRGSSSHAIATLKIQTQHYSRTMTLELWSKGKEKSLTKVLKPLREKGTITLKSGNYIYTYLPKTDRTIRLSSGMMMGAWMGSHLTNDDLVKESRLEDDFDAEISFEGKRNGQNIIEFTLLPKEAAAVVWGKIILEVEAERHLPIREIFYDEDMQVSRTFTFTGLKKMAGKIRPSIMHIVPADKPDEFTEFIFETLTLNVPINDSFFNKSALKRHKR